MNIGNITSNNFNLDGNGKDMQIEVYEQLIEQLQQENKQLKEVIDKAIKHVSSLSSKGRDCRIYANVKKDILDILKEVK